MKYPHEIKEEAELEILEAYFYYEEKQKGLGEKFLAQVQKYINRICENPLSFSSKDSLYRAAFIKKFPFLIIYEFYQNTVIVYSVFRVNGVNGHF